MTTAVDLGIVRYQDAKFLFKWFTDVLLVYVSRRGPVKVNEE